MTDQQPPADTRRGPEDPRREGPDVQPPPRSPMRTDRPAGPAASEAPVAGAVDPGPQVQRVTRDDAPDPPPVAGTGEEQDPADRARQQQNAATAADQPSG